MEIALLERLRHTVAPPSSAQPVAATLFIPRDRAGRKLERRPSERRPFEKNFVGFFVVFVDSIFPILFPIHINNSKKYDAKEEGSDRVNDSVNDCVNDSVNDSVNGCVNDHAFKALSCAKGRLLDAKGRLGPTRRGASRGRGSLHIAGTTGRQGVGENQVRGMASGSRKVGSG